MAVVIVINLVSGPRSLSGTTTGGNSLERLRSEVISGLQPAVSFLHQL